MANDKKLYVQARKSVTSLQGIKSPGDEVNEKMFKGGEDSLKGLIDKKVIGNEKPDIRTKAELAKEEADKKAAANAKAKEEADKKAAADAKEKEEADKKAAADAAKGSKK